ncbi:unnamed protein product [Acanthoscelides obtectus]|uniref:ER-bound oxygenase mpaB/mpaB'/Rubber oxygenase catalytic domain-containing protein n=1 Tax=Acanthoscelides obtectus TaxID=200917 RepID=A0A9P0KND2_ACAOB|nr:unnamed protein product [Acanthoscelides obtectus]CAK1626215.1 hypothetical protein AOBTE_LOCUS3685 [Acanthoscelides obtectus]
MSPKSERKESETDVDVTPAERYVNLLLTEGTKVTCDETNESFNRQGNYPAYYDEALFRRGQQFFYYHISGMFFNKLSGLLVVMGVPSILKILMATNMSSSDKTAYRRYMATILHMLQWYDEDFKPGTEAWNSLLQVRRMHNAASKKCAKKLNRITQAEMALTQFGFCGFALVRSKKVGIHSGTEEDWAAFLHFWRVIGWMLGIEDRFNLWQGSAQKTRDVCNLLINRVYRPSVHQLDANFVKMTRHLLKGIGSPVVQYEAMISYLMYLLQDEDEPAEEMRPFRLQITVYEKTKYYFTHFILRTMMSFDWFRATLNYVLLVTIWFIKYFPIIAYVQYGFENGRVVLNLKHPNDHLKMNEGDVLLLSGMDNVCFSFIFKG